MRLAAPLSVCLVMIASPALAQSQTQKNILDKIAESIVLSSLCPKLEVNETLAGFSVMYGKIDLDQSKYKNYLRNKIEQTRAGMERIKPEDGSSPEDLYCMTAMFLYGPKGVNASGLLQEKD